MLRSPSGIVGASALVIVLCSGYVAFASASAAPALAGRPASAEERAAIAREIASSERAWEEETARSFPSDLWSQRDDFHGREFKRVFDVKRAHGVRIEDVLEAVDDDVHLRRAISPNDSDPRDARAVPCKPRPVYD